MIKGIINIHKRKFTNLYPYVDENILTILIVALIFGSPVLMAFLPLIINNQYMQLIIIAIFLPLIIFYDYEKFYSLTLQKEKLFNFYKYNCSNNINLLKILILEWLKYNIFVVMLPIYLVITIILAPFSIATLIVMEIFFICLISLIIRMKISYLQIYFLAIFFINSLMNLIPLSIINIAIATMPLILMGINMIIYTKKKNIKKVDSYNGILLSFTLLSWIRKSFRIKQYIISTVIVSILPLFFIYYENVTNIKGKQALSASAIPLSYIFISTYVDIYVKDLKKNSWRTFQQTLSVLALEGKVEYAFLNSNIINYFSCFVVAAAMNFFTSLYLNVTITVLIAQLQLIIILVIIQFFWLGYNLTIFKFKTGFINKILKSELLLLAIIIYLVFIPVSIMFLNWGINPYIIVLYLLSVIFYLMNLYINGIKKFSLEDIQ